MPDSEKGDAREPHPRPPRGRATCRLGPRRGGARRDPGGPRRPCYICPGPPWAASFLSLPISISAHAARPARPWLCSRHPASLGAPRYPWPRLPRLRSPLPAFPLQPRPPPPTLLAGAME